MRNVGIIAILVGVGVIFISIAFSSKYHPALNLIGNIHRMEIILNEERKTKIRIKKKVNEAILKKAKEKYDRELSREPSTFKEVLKRYKYQGAYLKEKHPGYEEKYIIKEERVAIPLKYPLSLSVLLILLGTGIVLLSKKRK